ncbi:hypothetical protein F0562_012192 [Nyssa sinensis]|uniref:Uncharacterized protein n=1 Tax=Nyssa sinensis TaxID=561372 RepID=A0A5J4ZUX4_9ASTE|nr:hypothetical protein F0562_012192 [Nyssa sinensis]
MSGNEVDHVSISIDKKLAESSQVTFKACIFRVHGRLRNENTRAYEPEIIAIGPHHRGSEKLRGMEKHKLRYLQLLLLRKTESSLAKYVASMKGLERRARECYAESINLSTDEFVEMMILDGCFIIELFRKSLLNDVRERDRDDPIFQLSQIEHGIRHDLMLFENQLPMFILLELLQLTKESDTRDNIVDLALNFLGGVQYKNDDEWEFIKSTIEFREAGIKFKPHTKSTTLLDIKFEKGILRIPPLTINDLQNVCLEI